MDGPPAQEATHQAAHQIEELILAIEDLRQRVSVLEQRSELTGLPAEPVPELRARPLEAPPGDLTSGLLPALGRVLVGLAGAYLLRAMTEAEIVQQTTGTLAGILYAGGWLGGILRGRSPNRWAAPLQGLTSAAILAPLLWEATVRFHTLAPTATAAILALFMAGGQMAAWRRELWLVAGVVAGAGAATAVALLAATHDPVPFAMALLIAAAAVEYGACRDRALATRWIVALPADFTAFLLVYLLARPRGLPEGYAPVQLASALAIPWALAVIYVASLLARTLARRLPIGWFEAAEAVAAVALAIGGTLQLAHGTDGITLAIGAGCLAAAVGCYAVTLADARHPPRNLQAYALFALALVLLGGALLLSGLVLATFWSVAALAAIRLGERRRRNTLRVHGAFYLVAAALASGVMLGVPAPAAALLMTGAAGMAYLLSVWMHGARALPWTERVPPAISAAILCWSLVACLSSCAAAFHLSPPLSSTLRTALISLAAIALAWIGSRWNLRELIWLLYPWMAFGALKLVIEDFVHGRSATLFLSLLLYGGTLIALPRLLRRTKAARSDLS